MESKQKAGRPPGINKKMVSIKLPFWLAAWLKRQDMSQAQLIEKALTEFYRIKENGKI